MKQTFASLVSLKLSFKWSFGLSERLLFSFERLFKRVSPTLKHLELNFNENDHTTNVKDFPEILGIIIKDNLRKLESLCLEFTWTRFSTKIVRFLINAACPHLRSLKSLNLNFEGCNIAQEEEISYPKSDLTNNLQHLKLNFHYCLGLSKKYLDLLQDDILRECASLSELYLSVLNCQRFSDGYYLGRERNFFKLPLKKIQTSSFHEKLESLFGRKNRVSIVLLVFEMK